ncbi:sugar-binding transcriptional regulator [Streptococcus pacificus]|uniref:Sugar-binding transcriptional regulator n=1 Tax=Streptococcus pacificus TaxID=2740577 RepID=A0ABS0ZJZ6_9STRE|nr:sugar-binding transcriptional regulator [Streptococcus pacificus]MBJ8326264.1 sugar-binding transcriptional regulator [Streptococcus pacificus]
MSRLNPERKRLLAKVAYLHFVEGKNQTEIAKELNIYRTTISRMIARAKTEGIVKIEIADYDSNLFALEEYVRKKYHLKKIEIVDSSKEDDFVDTLVRVGQVASEVVRSSIKDNHRIGISWGKSLSYMISSITPRAVNDITVFPLAGGPSYINVEYHVNTLVHQLAQAFHGKSIFINATVIQENKELAQGILKSKYFEAIRSDWKCLDVAIVGIGGAPNKDLESQWRDLLSEKDYKILKKEKAVGEVCCRFFNEKGEPVYEQLQERTIGISLEQLRQVPLTIAIACGEYKSQAILAAIKAKFIDYLITDKQTILALLANDGDNNNQRF